MIRATLRRTSRGTIRPVRGTTRRSRETIRPSRETIAPAAPPAVHHLPSQLLTRAVRVLVVGCGGTGSEIASGLPYLHQAMLAHGHPAGLQVHLVDGDVVSETNTVRQPFGAADVGHPKATILAGRLNAFWQLGWAASPVHLADRHDDLETDIVALWADVVIGCVDSRAARAAIRDRIARCVPGHRPLYWLDLGNDAATGQFVLGQPAGAPGTREAGALRLPTVAELYPETCDVAGDAADTRPSCSAVEALTRQEPFVNRTLAAHALAMLARLFRYGQLEYHGAYVNLATGKATCLQVAPEQWARIQAANGAPVGRQRGRA